MNVYEAIMTRRSTRSYTDEAVDPVQLEKIIDAGRYAPSGGNSQSTHFFVIRDRKLLQELAATAQAAFAAMEVEEGMYRSLAASINRSKAGNYCFYHGAPVLIVLANQKDYGNNIADCACALENMMIMANDLDLGTCWINQLKWLNEDPKILEIFRRYGLEENERVWGALAVGHAATEDGLPNREALPRKGNPVTYID